MARNGSSRTKTTEIARRAARGCQISFGRLVRRLRLDRLLKVSPKYRARFDVQDVAQDAYIDFWRSIRRNPPKTGTRRLASAIARRKMTDHIRHHRAARRSAESDVRGELDLFVHPSRGAPTPDELLALREELDRSSERMPSDLREAFRLRSEGRSWPDVASQLGVRLTTLSSRVSRYFKPKTSGESG